MDLFPAIDLRGGRAVRLLQGDYAQETVYGDDPVALAESFAAAGARWIHVVDLDAARTGDPVNRPVVAAVAAAVRGRAKVQTGGGVRSVADAEALAAAGVARVVMGSAAVKDRTLVASVFRIVPVAVGLDHRDGDVALHGWTQGSGLNVMDLLDCYPDAEAFIITNIARDGMLTGPDIEGLAAAAVASPIPVIASGGVSSLDDLRMLNRVSGLAGVITGKAIYEHRFTVGEALETLAEPS
ncbi:MAG: 1-(5-phosphoribosyl)-5-((5-phosphoribosylamino)methylideneamino)imidazole-4-carboxamide isomerase [Actinobacteria bacterium]|uniref:1-(5-phosphoribosyl)-5-[(5-phosphoribosylamino)methylideneamino]imidazole-4-carboxamideisomerase n=1 Tax=freshwater metagenome TaxID=449393 RepID=A0A6J6VCD1_9ZZZZ|nr:1-(5-phosphoribosyl)-5-((5-phosphoribosylamino)methylideneamino)imidazole-4-carboxamide isomerase [Actinomycetota bacterium]MSZ05112.1 1-(5-phosphoribosyl)-5-((5-phosphoribosylamino)methylideneamino)imidazole-4-carboxamide isomerase [Actinomycetota bacterium]MTB06887.1 1-(5-phosphoribosyl)-5-((5-phosphoribosylamino)methylideneamino)imidazole-4-carboxamide isomerase [Actinomycetota bacterium]